MNKRYLNSLLSKYFDIEIHGRSYMKSLERKAKQQPSDMEMMKSLLVGEPEIIFDVGANDGRFALGLRSVFSTAHIYCFEPFHSTFKALEDNLKGVQGVDAYNLAVSDTSGSTIMYSNKNPDTNSLLPSTNMGLRSDAAVENVGSVEVKTTTIDRFCTDNGLVKIDVLKLDIQGAEYKALQGAEALLEKKAIRLVYLESYFRPQYVGQPLVHDIMSLLARYGYHIQDLYNPIYGNGSLAWCDLIFLPETNKS